MIFKYPVITILGGNNVGKSSLYNILTKKYNSLVNKISGFTIDRKYGSAKIKNFKFICIDTISYSNYDEKIYKNNFIVKEQILKSIKESNLILLIIKGNKLNTTDYKIIKKIRKYEKKIIILLNTKDKIFLDKEFYSLGIDFYIINFIKNNDILKLQKILFFYIKKIYSYKNYINELSNNIEKKNQIKLAIIGLPNVGKSTLINSIVNEKRMVVSNVPGTTRESILVPINNFNNFNKNIILIDTAGIKKKNKIKNKIEKFSILETYKMIKKSNIILYIIDGEKKIFCNKDISIIQNIISKGKPIILIINKLDLITLNDINYIKKLIKIKFNIFPIISISAKFLKNINYVFKLIYKIYNISNKTYNTSKLMKILYLATNSFLPPIHNGRRIKLKYISQNKNHPLIFKIYGNQVTKLNNNYKRYLLNFFYKELKCIGNIIILKFKENKNPYN
ncbi:ribosome biogenesis GTPase Der [Enterobacteriaceae endosymbiont of Donacia semicuprea]|uniref:ribosome biogenesis GTPase Der n=1 Tax=Enterobacteriaceae endosymbiont of Donacia semicuprea TaxID=2675783 RepID=UPI001449E1C1|nr:ribosome biogenesis GTPase Der [Enterobacteriaceae endosymbiont of Donacia semicuprea]QJC32732.1 ribosome biogenesis GTPase Der [Enterobacteriaceae endosymbiont of Donacia semicuprea]